MVAMIFAIQLFAAADGTYKSIVSEYTLASDGAITQRVSKVLKYNTHHSFFSLFGETFVVYNSEYQSVKVDTSYTVQKDGTVIVTPRNAFNYVLPSIAAKAPDYNKLTELVITHTGLELGATAFLDYTIFTEPGVVGSLDVEEAIGVAGADIEKYQVIVNVPDGVSLRWSLHGSNVKPVVKGGRYVWTFTNVKSAKGEANTPCGYGGVPRLSATTAAALAENLTPLTVQTLDLCRVPRNYLAGADSDKKRAEAVQKYIVQGLASCKVPPYLTVNCVRQCKRVMETAYGTEAEKALAMTRLMRAEGLQAQTVVAFPAAVEIKSLRNVAEYLVLCDGVFYSVRNMGESPLRWQSSHYSVYDLAGNKIEMSPSDTEIEFSADVTLSPRKAVVNGEYTVAPSRTANNKEKFSEEVTPYENSGYTIYKLPLPVSGSMNRWGLNKLSKERSAAFEIPYKVNETYEYTIKLDGVQSVTKNVKKSVKNSVGSLSVSIVNNGGSVVVKRSISMNMDVIPANKYKEFLEIMRLWNNDNLRKIVVKKK